MIHCTYGKLKTQISYLPLTIKQIRIVKHSIKLKSNLCSQLSVSTVDHVSEYRFCFILFYSI